MPSWVKKPLGEMNDFMLDDRLHVSVLGVRGHVVALTGVDPEPDPFDGWGTCMYTTLFIETTEARTRLKPKFVKLRPTAWERLDVE